MQRKYGYARQFGRGGNRACHCVRDVVEFQVEEYFKTKARKLMNRLRAFRGVKLAANLEYADYAPELPRHSERWGQTVEVQGDDQS